MGDKIQVIAVQLTRKCDQLCKHCFGNYGPRSTGELSFSDVKKYIDQAPEFETEVVTLTGGEPTLYKNLIETIKYADQVRSETGYPKKLSMVTNCSWFTTIEEAIKNMVTFKSAGLDDLLFSYDDFRPKINKTRVRVLNHIFIENKDKETDKYIPKLSIFGGKKITPLGRGRKLPKEYWFKRHKDNGKINFCSIDKWFIYNEDPPTENITSVFVGPNGLYGCGHVPEVMKMGELGEDIRVVPERIKEIGILFRALSIFDPINIASELGKYVDIPEFEDDCQACYHIFDEIKRDDLEKICSDGTMKEIISSLNPKKIKK